MLKGAKNLLHSGVMIIGMLSATPAIGEVTALDRYVAAPDSSYRYELIETIPGDGYATHVLEMTSQRWRDESEVDRPPRSTSSNSSPPTSATRTRAGPMSVPPRNS